MSKVWAVVVLTFIPLVSGMYAPPIGQNLSVEGGGEERLLVLEHDVFDTEDWNQLVSIGIFPLRVTAPNSMLVWAPQGVPIPSHYAVEILNDAVWKPGLSGADVGPDDVVRVVFEPRLPVDVKLKIAETIGRVGGVFIDEDVGPLLPIPTSIEVMLPNHLALQHALNIDGVLWIEPVLKTVGRNGQSASLHEHGLLSEHPFWEIGLNGTGVVLGIADSGLDADHACFRNATSPSSEHADLSAQNPAVGIFGESHRKILLLNTSIDGNDTPGHEDYRHGTHVAGTLACFDVSNYRTGALPSNGSSLAHGSTLVMQDIVSSEGWVAPSVDELLYESSMHDAFIHSNSWGDATTAYTERTANFDGFAKAMPWSLAFIAPGNSGSGVLEPANGRNVVSVGATTKAIDAQRWGSSAYGPTEVGTDGIFLLATGGSVQSAGADGDWSSNNNNLRSSSGTSMATPAAAGAAGIVQQMYQDGWLTGSFETLHAVPLSAIQPPWMEQGISGNTSLLLGPGFTPSGSLVRATLALASSPLNQGERNGGLGGNELHNEYDGWGRLNLSALFDPTALHSGSSASPANDVWAHDSYRLAGTTPSKWMEQYGGQQNNLSGLLEQSWDGSQAAGPFLKTGERFQQRFTPLENTDVIVRLAYPAQPEPSMVDDLQLRVTLPDGTVMIPDRIHADGTPTLFNGSIANFDDVVAFPNNNETTLGINIPHEILANHSYIDVEIVARYVAPGGSESSVGLNGDRLGFGLVIKGVDRDSDAHLDGDGDGVANAEDDCPNENAIGEDGDGDGCIDDDDGDDVVNPNDDCPDVNAMGYDTDGDGCIDDSDLDGVADNVDLCLTEDLGWPVDSSGCYPTDNAPTIEPLQVPENGTVWNQSLIVAWSVQDMDGDGYRTGARLIPATPPSFKIAECEMTKISNETMSCQWTLSEYLPLHYLGQEDFILQIFVETNNASPAAFLQPVNLNVSMNITIDFQNEVQIVDPPLTVTSSSAPILTWMMVGLILGVLFSYWRSKRRPYGLESGQTPPPFAQTSFDIIDSNAEDE